MRKFWILGGVILVLVTVMVAGAGITFAAARAKAEQEWNSKMPNEPRSSAEVRGLVNGLYQLRDEVTPAFVPRSGWDNVLCAAAVIEATNFILGEQRLDMASAWEFSTVNSDQISLVWEREQDFKVVEGRIVETKDRGFWLSKILELDGPKGSMTSDRLYVVGYHYHETLSDGHILEAGLDINSHLMLIVGRFDGSWWGYHMLHDQDDPLAHPFRIDSLGDEMPEWFDLVYIWEITGTEMPYQGEPVALVQNGPRYQEIIHLLGRGHFMDTVTTALFVGGEQFPVVLQTDQPVVVLQDAYYRGHHGQLLGFVNGVAVRQHAGDSRRGRYGLEFQCVELINRYYAERLGHRNMTKSGHADSYFFKAEAKGLESFPNGSPEPPRVNDILIFDGGDMDGAAGHVAIVYEVADEHVCFAQQNYKPWYGCLPLAQGEAGWLIEPLEPTLPCIGWARSGDT